MHPNLRILVALSLIDNVGARRTRQLLERVDDPADIFSLTRRDLLAMPGIGNTIADHILGFSDWAAVDRILAASEQKQSTLITSYDDRYPRRLREIFDPPVLLWVLGEPMVLSEPGISVIGTRSPSGYGNHMAELFTRGLCEAGLTIISGFAYGIDTVAHKTCLAAGGRTIAVLGSGIDRIYPAVNAFLVDEITGNGGCVITEFPPGTKPDYSNFPVRNRVVSGLALGVLVVESGLTGGSMITARLALDQNREIFVVPHPVTAKRGEGNNTLIRDCGGKLVTHVGDMLDELPGWTGSTVPAMQTEPAWKTAILTDDQAGICAYLDGKGRVHIDQMQMETGLDASKLLSTLLTLEFEGCIRQYAGKMFEICD